jgi:phenylacetate-CoA ligase
LAVPRERIVDVCLTSSSTRQEPTMLLQTRRDLKRLARNEAGAFAMAGLTAGDRLMICVAIDRCFMAGLAYFLGGMELGIELVRAGSSSAAQAWELALLTRPTALIGVPSMLRCIGEAAIVGGHDPSRLGVRRMLAIGDSVRDAQLALTPAAAALEQTWGAVLHGTYASTEMATAFCECEARAGGHLRPELIALEILDDDGEPVAEGRMGEVVVTPLGVRGMPLLRYRTGDIAYLITAPCSCGRRTPRLSPVLGRKNQMLKFKGTTLFPGMILSILEGESGVVGGYVEALRHADGSDRVVVAAAIKDPALTAERLAQLLQARLRVMPEVRLVDPAEWESRVHVAGKRKPQVFFDLRGEEHHE